MYFYDNGKKVKISNNIFFHKLGSGKEVNAYRYNNKVIKILKNKKINDDINMEKSHLVLTDINTNQIILPNKLFYDKNDKYVANESRYIKKEKKSLLEYSLEEIIFNLEILENDIEEISKKFIRIRDLDISNCVLGDNIYIVDFGFFRLDLEELNSNDYIRTKEMNEYALKVFFINEIVSILEKKKINSQKIYEYYLKSLKEKILLSELLKENNEINKIYKKRV